MKGILVRAGIDHSYGQWNAPVDPESNKSVYVPIAEQYEKISPEKVNDQCSPFIAEWDG